MIRVLIVDDHKLFREGVNLLLMAAPDVTIVGEARDGQEAMELAQRVQPDVILMDIEMPKLNGFQATQQLVGGGSAAKVVILSMRTDENDVRTAACSGAKGYLVKNCGREELISAIRLAHQNQPAVSPEVARFFLAQPGNT